MSRNDIDVFHIFQALPPSHFGEPVTDVEMAASTRRRGTLGRWPTTAGAAAMGIFAFLGIIHSAKGAILLICFLNVHFLRQGVKPVSRFAPSALCSSSNLEVVRGNIDAMCRYGLIKPTLT